MMTELQTRLNKIESEGQKKFMTAELVSLFNVVKNVSNLTMIINLTT